MATRTTLPAEISDTTLVGFCGAFFSLVILVLISGIGASEAMSPYMTEPKSDPGLGALYAGGFTMAPNFLLFCGAPICLFLLVKSRVAPERRARAARAVITGWGAIAAMAAALLMGHIAKIGAIDGRFSREPNQGTLLNGAFSADISTVLLCFPLALIVLCLLPTWVISKLTRDAHLKIVAP